MKPNDDLETKASSIVLDHFYCICSAVSEGGAAERAWAEQVSGKKMVKYNNTAAKKQEKLKQRRGRRAGWAGYICSIG